MFRRSLAPLLLLISMASLGAQEVLFHHVPDPQRSAASVEAVALFSRPAPGGYLPVRFTVVNPDEKEAIIQVSTSSSDSNYSSGQDSEVTSGHQIIAKGRNTTVQDVLVPLVTLFGNSYGGSNITADVKISGTLGNASGSLTSQYTDGQPSLLLSEPLYTPNASSLDGHLATRGHHRFGTPTFAGRFDPAKLPEDWRAYSCYDGIGMTDLDWGKVPAAARTALMRWNRLGGTLVIYSLSSGTDISTLGIDPAAKGKSLLGRSLGRVQVTPLGADLKLEPSFTEDLFSAKANLPPLNSSVTQDFSSAWPLQAAFGEQRYRYGLFIVILIAFGILVGPVNLFVLAKSGRRHRLFITTPIIALGTSLLLVLMILVTDGLGGRGIRVALMEVRPEDGENMAYVTQEQVSRTGVLLGGNFTLDESAVITRVPMETTPWTRLTASNGGGGMRYEIGLQDGKTTVNGDWFQSRSEQGHLLRGIVPTRGRLEARNDAGAPSFLSTFDFTIQRLYYLDDSGGWWTAEDVAPGRAFTCTPADAKLAIDFATSEMAGSLQNRLRRKILDSRDGLIHRPGHFIAVSENAPGIATLNRIDWIGTRTFVTGPVVKP